MKIIINALQYKQNSSGIGVMIRELFGPFTRQCLEDSIVILPQDSPAFEGGKKTRFIRVGLEHGNSLRRVLFQLFRMGWEYCKDSTLMVTDSKTPLFLPRSCKLVPLVTDLAVYRMPEVYQRSRVMLWRLQYWYVRRRAVKYLAISEFTKGEIMELFHVDGDKVEVVPCACPAALSGPATQNQVENLRERYALPERFVLFVGNYNPRKNLERLLAAFDMATEHGAQQRLVIAGGQGWKFSEDKAVSGIKYRDRVHFIGFVPDEDMAALYTAADLFAFPTLYEGFGIPILEAQRCGTPVLASNCSAMPEVAGDSAELVDPYDVQDICRGMLRVLNEDVYAQELVRLGYENCNRFSWDKSAQMLAQIMEEVVKR